MARSAVEQVADTEPNGVYDLFNSTLEIVMRLAYTHASRCTRTLGWRVVSWYDHCYRLQWSARTVTRSHYHITVLSLKGTMFCHPTGSWSRSHQSRQQSIFSCHSPSPSGFQLSNPSVVTERNCLLRFDADLLLLVLFPCCALKFYLWPWWFDAVYSSCQPLFNFWVHSDIGNTLFPSCSAAVTLKAVIPWY